MACCARLKAAGRCCIRRKIFQTDPVLQNIKRGYRFSVQPSALKGKKRSKQEKWAYCNIFSWKYITSWKNYEEFLWKECIVSSFLSHCLLFFFPLAVGVPVSFLCLFLVWCVVLFFALEAWCFLYFLYFSFRHGLCILKRDKERMLPFSKCQQSNKSEREVWGIYTTMELKST